MPCYNGFFKNILMMLPIAHPVLPQLRNLAVISQRDQTGSWGYNCTGAIIFQALEPISYCPQYFEVTSTLLQYLHFILYDKQA